MFGLKSKFKKAQRVYVGLSGGVDSAVSAALLKEQGFDVTGVFIRIALPGYPCTSGEDKIEAQRVAAHLKIPFKSIDLSDDYAKGVFQNTIEEFKKGRTPNPDTLCNQKIKFGAFFDWCIKDGAEFVATGHYAQAKDGRLYKGADETKDQSYFLWMVPKNALLKTVFPVGGMQKTEVRRLAKKYTLPNARRRDSQGLCFLGGISIEDMLMRELAPKPGDVLNGKGEIVGKHRGAALYTLGQRHGFELLANSPETPVHFVISKNIEMNTITVSESRYPANAAKTAISLADINWIEAPVTEKKYAARFRYRQTLISARLSSKKEALLEEPHYAPVGQSLVFYCGNECIGGGTVDSVSIQ